MEEQMSTATVLIVDDEPEIRQVLQRCLKPLEARCLQAADAQSAVRSVQAHFPDVVILDVRLPDANGLEVLTSIRNIAPDTAVIMLTAFDDSRIAVEAIKNGALDYLTKPVDVDTFRHKVHQALEHVRLRRQLALLDESEVNPISFHGLVGRSTAIRRIFQLLSRIGPTDAPVLIYGESGTGKRMVAEVLHRLSPRRKGPFVVVDCGTIPANLIESELFGFEKGAFTGADHRKIGQLERAQGGTVLLDEIANLPADGQAKLLRALDEHVIQRLGSTETLELDVRILAASNQDLSELVTQGRFREDLYFRLNVFEIHLPPLRERIEDIPLLAEYFLSTFRDKYNKNIRGFRPEVIYAFLRYDWPGNIRELRNAVERGVALAEEWIGVGELPPNLHKASGTLADLADDEGDFAERARRILEETEKRLIEEALERAGGNRRRAAELLGISLRTLYYKMEKYLEKPEFD